AVVLRCSCRDLLKGTKEYTSLKTQHEIVALQHDPSIARFGGHASVFVQCSKNVRNVKESCFGREACPACPTLARPKKFQPLLITIHHEPAQSPCWRQGA